MPTSEDQSSEAEHDYEDASEIDQDIPIKSRPKKLGKALQDSDSEHSVAEEDEEVQGWGTSRKDYYNADAIETEADALEEETEARRLQQKQLQGMTEADFGLDEVDWLEAEKEDVRVANRDGNIVREVLPKLEITDAMKEEERMNIMRIRYPEFEPLATEFVDLQEPYHDLGKRATEYTKALVDKDGESGASEDSPMPNVALKSRALGAYLSSLSIYFTLLTSSARGLNGKSVAMPPEQLREHSVMDTLVRCRDIWEKVKDLGGDPPVKKSNGILSDQPRVEEDSQLPTSKSQDQPRIRRPRKSKSQKAAEVAQAEAEVRRQNRIRETEASLADLTALTIPSKSSAINPTKAPLRSNHTAHDSGSDIGDQTTLTHEEAAEKAKRKKTLRFYTSQIAQKSNKRGAAGRDAGGDTDLPYRERLKDRQARLNAEAEKRGGKFKENIPGEELGGESDNEDRAAARELRNGGEGGEEDYYNLISSHSAKKKAEKAALASLHAQAEAEGGIVRVVDDGTVGPDGKRAISYAIEKNKGLAPKRKKDVRNPRVKKRKKFEDKKKKLGSVRPVFKGGEGRGGYKGELTGIKKGLVRAVRL